MIIHYHVKNLNLFNPKLQPIQNELRIKGKFKKMLRGLKKFQFQSILVLEYIKGNDCIVFRSNIKLITSDLNIDKAFKSMHQTIMVKINNSAREKWVVIIKHSIKIFESSHRKVEIIRNL